MTRPPLEVADIVRQYGAAYLARYGHVTSTAQQRVLRALTLCRTAALGGHTTACDQCGHLESSYRIQEKDFLTNVLKQPWPIRSANCRVQGFLPVYW